MDLKELVNRGDLSGAVAAATSAVKARPSDISARTALFELLCFAGDLDRAEKQLTVLADDGMELAYAATMLKALVGSERKRRQVMAGQAEPQTRPDAPAWAPALGELVVRAGRGEDVGADVERLLAARQPVRGTLGGQPFSDLRDGDDLLAPCLELHFGGNTWWVDWRFVSRLEARTPRTLREALWLPVTITVGNGASFEAALPTQYVDTHASDDERLKLGLDTEWVERGGVVRGLGRKVFYVDGEPRDALELGELVIEG